MPVLKATTDLSSLPLVRDYVLSMARTARVPDEVKPKLDLVLEEVLVNVATHAYGGSGGNVAVNCTVHSGLFCVVIQDWGIPFDPLAAKKPSLDEDIDHRPIGGLGLLLVTTMTDECSYSRLDDMNQLTLCFSL